MPKTTERRYYRIDRRQIHFFRFILEGYDGVAHIGPGCQSMVDVIVQDLQRQVRIEPVEDATWQQGGHYEKGGF
jgi:hypothetical protein